MCRFYSGLTEIVRFWECFIFVLTCVTSTQLYPNIISTFQENGASILKQGLQNNTSVTRLGLVGCRLTEQGTIAVAEFLAESTIVERFQDNNFDLI